MTEGPEEDDADRRWNNTWVAVAAAVLIVLGVVLMQALSHHQRIEACIAAGHRDCVPIDTGR
ncbi:MAG: hypothetical protein JO261_16375 [Alphaproteobacteria bacterium]|nr:hypothetical protein [Alphaproteobacteria bacterium]MBV9695269.1 hypothetical protein [Alphaproteobacteria bacterium]